MAWLAIGQPINLPRVGPCGGRILNFSLRLITVPHVVGLWEHMVHVHPHVAAADVLETVHDIDCDYVLRNPPR